MNSFHSGYKMKREGIYVLNAQGRFQQKGEKTAILSFRTNIDKKPAANAVKSC